MRETFIRHHNHNQFRLIRWAEDNVRTETSQGNNYVRNIQWMVKEVIHNNTDEFLATKLQSGMTIRANVTPNTNVITTVKYVELLVLYGI